MSAPDGFEKVVDRGVSISSIKRRLHTTRGDFMLRRVGRVTSAYWSENQRLEKTFAGPRGSKSAVLSIDDARKVASIPNAVT